MLANGGHCNYFKKENNARSQVEYIEKYLQE